MESDFDPTVRFVGREVFPPTDEHAALLRFLLCVRQLGALRESVSRLTGSKDPGEREGLHFHVLLFVGAAKEAADAFRDCDARGYFRWLDQPNSGLDDVRHDLATARRHTNKAEATSIYSRILKPFRDRAAFHFSRDAVGRALETLTDETFAAAAVGEHGDVKAVPLAAYLLARLTWAADLTETDMRRRIDDLFDLQAALRNVAHDFYFALVRVTGSAPAAS